MNQPNNTNQSPDIAVTARKFWLAGIGAYAKAFEITRDRLLKINDSGSVFFKELIARGEEIESLTQDQVVRVRTEARTEIEARIQRIREALSQPPAENVDSEDLVKLQKENELLKRKVQRLSARQVNGVAKKAA